ncbi:MAG: acetyl-CoA C-acyltransferase FadI [Vicinamibacteria bacterium]
MSVSSESSPMQGRRVAFVAGCRTPFARAGGTLADLSALDLGRLVTAELVQRSAIDPREIDQVVLGTVVHDVKASNLAREVVLGAGLPPTIEAYTVSRACASSNQAIVGAAEAIASGQADTVIAGGAESLSHVPILVSKPLTRALLAARKAKTLAGRLKGFSKLRLKDLAPVAPAIAELSTGLTMGESAEKMAKENGISREAQDEFALRSHRLAAAATDDGRLPEEIIRVYIPLRYTKSLGEDDGIRRDTSLEALGSLRPVFDRRYGSLTAGNSSPLTDGAAAMLLMSEEKAKALGYRPLGYVRSYAFCGVDPFDQLLIGPALSTPTALRRAGLTLGDMDLIDLHEAFAAQVLSVLQAFESATFARERLGRSEPLGQVDMDRLNVTGGSIAIGHPFAATGARITLSLLNELRRRGQRFGLIGVCAAGGLGFSMVVETE